MGFPESPNSRVVYKLAHPVWHCALRNGPSKFAKARGWKGKAKPSPLQASHGSALLPGLATPGPGVSGRCSQPRARPGGSGVLGDEQSSPRGPAGGGGALRHPRGDGVGAGRAAGPTCHEHDEDGAALLGGGDSGRDGAAEPQHGPPRARAPARGAAGSCCCSPLRPSRAPAHAPPWEP